jgi:hypothetical protein
MVRPLAVIALAAALLTAAAGCRQNCGGPGWFTSNTNTHCAPPGQLVSRGNCDVCADPAFGAPPPAFPGGATMVPGGATVFPGGPGVAPSPDNVLPVPEGLIPRQNIPPYAIPQVAPPMGLVPGSGSTVPVRK